MTKAYFKTQLLRLLDNRMVTLWLLIAGLIAIYHQLTTTISRGSWNTAPTAYQIMIGFDFSSLSSLYYLVFPLVASLIGSFVLSDSRAHHSYFFEITKLGKTKYTLVNMLVTFLVGGGALTLPLVLDALIALTREQGVIIDPFTVSGQVISPGTTYFASFIHSPLQFVLGYLGLFFAFSGMMATTTFLIFKLTNRRSIAILLVFIVFLSEWLIGPLVGLAEISPAIFLIPSQGYNVITPWLMAVNLFLTTGLIAILYWRVVQTDDIK